VKLLQQPKVAYILIGVVILGGILIGILEATPIRNQLNVWKLLPEPERLTELYFNNNAQLPTHYIPGQPQKTSFTVHNLEYQNTAYFYTVTAVPDGSTTSTALANGVLSLAQNQSVTTPITVTLPDLGPRVKVVVKLSNENESIDYWVTKGVQ
jgi:hypothetical protein